MCNGFQISSHSHGTLCPASVPLTPELSMNVTPTAGTNTATANLDTLVPGGRAWGFASVPLFYVVGRVWWEGDC